MQKLEKGAGRRARRLLNQSRDFGNLCSDMTHCPSKVNNENMHCHGLLNTSQSSAFQKTGRFSDVDIQ
jgi:hypothetical protein